MAGESAERQYAQQRSQRLDRIKGSWPSIAAMIGVAFAVGWIVPIIFMSAAMFMLESVASDERSLTVAFPPIAVSLFSGVGFAVGAAGQLLGPSRAEAAWGSGAEGERVVGRALDDLRGDGVRVLHDRRIPGSRANIDHLAISPAGVFTVDAKRYTGKLEVRGRGSELWIKGRNRSKLLEQAHRQAEVVRSLLQQSGFDGVEVTPTLCFVNTEIPLLFAPKQAGGVLLGKPRQLRSWVISDGGTSLGPSDVVAIAGVLDKALVPATNPPAGGRDDGRTVAPSTRAKPTPSPGFFVTEATAQDGPTRSPPVCRCGQDMVVRTRRRDGQRFFGCSTYPKCRNTQPLDST